MQPNNTHSFGNMDNVQESNFEPVPAGTYEMMCVGMEMKATKAGTGHYLAAQFAIRGGDFDNRRIFQNYNLDNPNQTAVEIALRDVKGWLGACGAPTGGELTMEKINALEGKPFFGKVSIKKSKTSEFDDENKIRFLPAGDQAPPFAPQAAPQGAANQMSQPTASSAQAPANDVPAFLR